MAPKKLDNLLFIDQTKIDPPDLARWNNAIIAQVPEAMQHTLSHQDLANEIEDKIQVKLPVQDIFKFDSDFIIQINSYDARARILYKGFITVHRETITFVPWKAQHKAHIIPMQTLLASYPINQFLAAKPSAHERYENLYVYITGLPPHLASPSLVHYILGIFCKMRTYEFRPPNLQYYVTAFGRLTSVPQTVHIGFKSNEPSNDNVYIWRVELQTYTDEMLGRETPPMLQMSDHGGSSGLNTEERWNLAIPPSPPEGEATSKYRSSSSSYVQGNSDDESHGWESDRSRTST